MLGSGRLFHVDELSALTRGRRSVSDHAARLAPCAVDGPAIADLSAWTAAVDGDPARDRRRDGRVGMLVILSAAIAVIATGAAGVTVGRQRCRGHRGADARVHAGVHLPVDPADERRAGDGRVDAVLPVLRHSHRRACVDSIAGIACAIAVLIRPNLAPLAIVPFVLARNRVAFSIPVAIAAVALAVPSVALVRIAVAIRLRLGRRAVLAREHRRQRVALLQLADRDRADPVPGGVRLRAIAARSQCAGTDGVRVAGDRRLPGLRRLRRLVVPALPAAGDGGVRDLHGGRAVGVDQTLAAGCRAPILFALALLRDRARHLGGALARYVQARRSTAARLTRSPTSSTRTSRPPR